MVMGPRRVLLSFVLAAMFGSARYGWAEPLYDKPVYDPASKSYFELVLIRTTQYSYGGHPEVRWEQADGLARARVYNGVHGRLAVIRNLETHEFLELTFQPVFNAWIGLRYWCSNRTLQFTDGTLWTRSMFGVWDAKWDQSAVKDPCGEYHTNRKPQYMPVAYNSIKDGFRWIAKEWHKAYYCYFVEYPTGHP